MAKLTRLARLLGCVALGVSKCSNSCFARPSKRGPGLGLGFGFGSGHRNGGRRLDRIGRSEESQSGKIIVPAGIDIPAAQMFHQRVVTLVLGNDVEGAGGLANAARPR